MKRKVKASSMRRTPEVVSRKRQEIRQKADIWRAGIAAARAAGAGDKVAYGEAQVALLAKEMKALLREGKKQFWKD
jgi:hypothetical protein